LKLTSHNTSINTKCSSYPIIGVEGLLKLVEVAKKIQATQVSTNSEGVVCQNNLSPPANKPDSTITLDKATTTQSKAVGISTQSDAGEADEVSNSSKGA
jgi:nucleoid-associated protein YgaU